MLTVVQIRALKPAERPYKVADSDGLYLLVQPSGALLWRFRYRCCGIERKLSLGSFPDISLIQARRKRDEAKAECDDRIDGQDRRVCATSPYGPESYGMEAPRLHGPRHAPIAITLN